MSEVSEVDLAYAAGVFDAEGCVSIGNTDKRLVDWFKQRFGGYTSYSTSPSPLHKDKYAWTLQSSRAYDVLSMLFPYLVIKRVQARIGQMFQTTVLTKPGRLTEETKLIRATCKHELHIYNHRGKSPTDSPSFHLSTEDLPVIDYDRSDPNYPSTVLAYTAGILDGDGCISLTTQPTTFTRIGKDPSGMYAVLVRISNTNFTLLSWLHNRFGGWYHTYPDNYDYDTNRKKCHWWAISRQPGINFLKLIQPYLLLKSDRAQIAIDYQSTVKRYGPKGIPDSIRQERIKMKERLTLLNKRGK